MTSLPSFRFVADWQRLPDAAATSVLDFWHRERANVEGRTALQRVREVATRVLTPGDELAAVSTAGVRTIPRLGQPMYYYRCFAGAAWRGHVPMRALIHHTYMQLDAWARTHDFPCIGLLLELENTGFQRTLQRAYWPMTPELGFSFIGRSAKGQDLRVCYFRGARLHGRIPQRSRAHSRLPAHLANS